MSMNNQPSVHLCAGAASAELNDHNQTTSIATHFLSQLRLGVQKVPTPHPTPEDMGARPKKLSSHFTQSIDSDSTKRWMAQQEPTIEREPEDWLSQQRRDVCRLNPGTIIRLLSAIDPDLFAKDEASCASRWITNGAVEKTTFPLLPVNSDDLSQQIRLWDNEQKEQSQKKQYRQGRKSRPWEEKSAHENHQWAQQARPVMDKLWRLLAQPTAAIKNEEASVQVAPTIKDHQDILRSILTQNTRYTVNTARQEKQEKRRQIIDQYCNKTIRCTEEIAQEARRFMDDMRDLHGMGQDQEEFIDLEYIMKNMEARTVDQLVKKKKKKIPPPESERIDIRTIEDLQKFSLPAFFSWDRSQQKIIRTESPSNKIVLVPSPRDLKLIVGCLVDLITSHRHKEEISFRDICQSTVTRWAWQNQILATEKKLSAYLPRLTSCLVGSATSDWRKTTETKKSDIQILVKSDFSEQEGLFLCELLTQVLFVAINDEQEDHIQIQKSLISFRAMTKHVHWVSLNGEDIPWTPLINLIEEKLSWMPEEGITVHPKDIFPRNDHERKIAHTISHVVEKYKKENTQRVMCDLFFKQQNVKKSSRTKFLEFICKRDMDLQKLWFQLFGENLLEALDSLLSSNSVVTGLWQFLTPKAMGQDWTKSKKEKKFIELIGPQTTWNNVILFALKNSYDQELITQMGNALSGNKLHDTLIKQLDELELTLGTIDDDAAEEALWLCEEELPSTHPQNSQEKLLDEEKMSLAAASKDDQQTIFPYRRIYCLRLFFEIFYPDALEEEHQQLKGRHHFKEQRDSWVAFLEHVVFSMSPQIGESSEEKRNILHWSLLHHDSQSPLILYREQQTTKQGYTAEVSDHLWRSIVGITPKETRKAAEQEMARVCELYINNHAPITRPLQSRRTLEKNSLSTDSWRVHSTEKTIPIVKNTFLERLETTSQQEDPALLLSRELRAYVSLDKREELIVVLDLLSFLMELKKEKFQNKTRRQLQGPYARKFYDFIQKNVAHLLSWVENHPEAVSILTQNQFILMASDLINKETHRPEIRIFHSRLRLEIEKTSAHLKESLANSIQKVMQFNQESLGERRDSELSQRFFEMNQALKIFSTARDNLMGLKTLLEGHLKIDRVIPQAQLAIHLYIRPEDIDRNTILGIDTTQTSAMIRLLQAETETRELNELQSTANHLFVFPDLNAAVAPLFSDIATASDIRKELKFIQKYDLFSDGLLSSVECIARRIASCAPEQKPALKKILKRSRARHESFEKLKAQKIFAQKIERWTRKQSMEKVEISDLLSKKRATFSQPINKTFVRTWCRTGQKTATRFTLQSGDEQVVIEQFFNTSSDQKTISSRRKLTLSENRKLDGPALDSVYKSVQRGELGVAVLSCLAKEITHSLFDAPEKEDLKKENKSLWTHERTKQALHVIPALCSHDFLSMVRAFAQEKNLLKGKNNPPAVFVFADEWKEKNPAQSIYSQAFRITFGDTRTIFLSCSQVFDMSKGKWSMPAEDLPSSGNLPIDIDLKITFSDGTNPLIEIEKISYENTFFQG